MNKYSSQYCTADEVEDILKALEFVTSLRQLSATVMLIDSNGLPLGKVEIGDSENPQFHMNVTEDVEES